jgi:hypothetical protein
MVWAGHEVHGRVVGKLEGKSHYKNLEICDDNIKMYVEEV